MLHAEPHLRWVWEPGIVVPLAVSGVWYAAGVARQWRETHGRGVRRAEVACFVAGWSVLVLALVSPLHPLGEELLWAHMVQHMLLMMVAAPLLVLGRPLIPMLWALSPGGRRRVGRWGKVAAVRGTWRTLTRTSVAWVVQAVVLWGWHVPALYQRTIESDVIHALQHGCFLGAAVLFWWSLLRGVLRGGAEGHRARERYGIGVVSLFTTALHSGALGALMTVSQTVWYPVYRATAPDWGFTPQEDQQLAGLIMWIPTGMVYTVAALVLFALWLRPVPSEVLPPDVLPSRVVPS